MNPGRYRQPITFEEYTQVKDETGGYTDDWTPFKTVWASVNPLQGRELERALQINNELTHRIEIRYLAGLKPSMRVNFKGRIFQIHSIVNVDERNKEMILMCLEESA